ncbi:unnamed protein product [Withania somnifera]
MCSLAPKTRIMIELDAFLRVWWAKMSKVDDVIKTQIGYLPSLMEMKPWLETVQVFVRFLDNGNMVFRFGDVELTPTIEEVLYSYESVHTHVKRKNNPDNDLLIPLIWYRAQIEERFLLANDDWIGRL